MTIDDIKELSQINSRHGLCVSLFLNIDKTHQDRHDITTKLNHLINEEEKNLSAGHDAAKHLRADYATIWRFVENELVTAKNKRGLALFTNSEMNYFKAIFLTKPVDDRILFSTRFLVRPLVRYLDDNAKILVVFVDQSRARIVEMEQGDVTKFIEFEDEVPKKVKAGSHYGLADKRIERHVQWHIRGHLKKVVDMTLDLLKQDGYQWLFVYGLGEELTNFVKMLHPYTKNKLVFEEQVDMLDEHDKEKYLGKILDSLDAVEKKQHQEINDELFEDFPHRAVLGLEDASNELDRKSVFKLILSNRFSQVFPVCNKCDYLVHDQLVCPNCGADLSLIDWESNELVIKALFQDSEVHFVDSPSLDAKGGVGAILRYEAIRKAA